MPAFDDDDDRDLAGALRHSSYAHSSDLPPGSQDGSSDDELDDTMRDADDAETAGENAGDEDVDGDAESPSNSSQASDGYTRQEDQSQAKQNRLNTSISLEESFTNTAVFLPPLRPEIVSATTYDIVPTIAAPQSTSINAITATADTRWVFSGGSDGYIRKYNWVDTINGKLMLTVAQRHPFVDSVLKAGVLMTYWENWDISSRNAPSHNSDDANVLSPVYSLAVQHQGLWLLSGLESGMIRLQSIRHDEGKDIATLQKHTSAVSVLSLSSDEKSILSGSWDKTVLDWDLNIGKVRTVFSSGTVQISAIESRPISSLSVPEESGELPMANGTYSYHAVNGTTLSALANGEASRDHSQPPTDEAGEGSPDSLFGGDGGDDDLFGDSAGVVTTNGVPLADAYGEEMDVISHTLAHDHQAEENGGMTMTEADPVLQPVQPPETAAPEQDSSGKTLQLTNGVTYASNQPVMNGLSHAEESQPRSISQANSTVDAGSTSDSTFLATSIDGTIRVWDRREATPVARIVPRNAPPWCMSACWSPDGNYIYAGRRNCAVEEYDLRKGLKFSERIFKFPQGSGAVTSVKAMPNGRHLIWYVLPNPFNA